MSKSLKLPYYTIDANMLADWLESQSDSWWTVDGDPVLTSRVDFPCPCDELSAELRRIGKRLRVFDPRTNSPANGKEIRLEQLDELADRDNKSRAQTFLLCWDGDTIEWLLSEFQDDPNGAT